jgi:hypothetical protein
VVRILSRRGDRTAPEQRVSDEDAMVADRTRPVDAREDTEPVDDRTDVTEQVRTDEPAVARHPVADRVADGDGTAGTTYGSAGTAAAERAEGRAEGRAEERAAEERAAEGAGPVADERVGPVEDRPAVPARPRWNRVSFGATLGLILGLTALYAVLTGTLAQVGLLVGVVGFLLASSGFAGARRDGVTGHSLALLGMLCSAAAIVLGVLAITDTLPWLSTGKDNVPLVRDWVDTHLPWIKHW